MLRRFVFQEDYPEYGIVNEIVDGKEIEGIRLINSAKVRYFIYPVLNELKLQLRIADDSAWCIEVPVPPQANVSLHHFLRKNINTIVKYASQWLVFDEIVENPHFYWPKGVS